MHYNSQATNPDTPASQISAPGVPVKPGRARGKTQQQAAANSRGGKGKGEQSGKQQTAAAARGRDSQPAGGPSNHLPV